MLLARAEKENAIGSQDAMNVGPQRDARFVREAEHHVAQEDELQQLALAQARGRKLPRMRNDEG
ncbi:MAG TPA: hypothetical protein VND90_04930 [Terracidiphilus sp.]|nr:hypothetical protein [Terracidiphilus sp.]